MHYKNAVITEFCPDLRELELQYHQWPEVFSKHRVTHSNFKLYLKWGWHKQDII